MTRWWVVLMLVGSCSRGGFEPYGDGALVFEGTSAVPFDGAVGEALEIDNGAARLAREPGFEAGATQLTDTLAGAVATPVGDDILFSAGSQGALDGFPADCSDQLWRLNVASGELSDAGTLPRGNQGHGLIVDSTGGLVLVMGCCNCGSNEEERAYRRPPGSADFEQIGTFPVYAYSIAASLYNDGGADRIVVAGGRGSGPLRNAIQVLDVGSGLVDLWSERLPSPRCLSTSVIVGTTMLVFGGHTHPNCTVVGNSGTELTLDEIVAIDLVGETVEVVGHLPQSLGGACAVARDGEVLVFGGFNYTGGTRTLSSAIYSVDPVTRAITTRPDTMPAARAGMACAADSEGRIVLAGGVDDSGVATRSVWLFEPYSAEGTLTSDVVDSGLSGAKWEVDIESDQPLGTTVEVQLRASDRASALEDAPWEVAPRGRYVQWRATLRSNNAAVTPLLHSVQLAFRAR